MDSAILQTLSHLGLHSRGPSQGSPNDAADSIPHAAEDKRDDAVVETTDRIAAIFQPSKFSWADDEDKDWMLEELDAGMTVEASVSKETTTLPESALSSGKANAWRPPFKVSTRPKTPPPGRSLDDRPSRSASMSSPTKPQARLARMQSAWKTPSAGSMPKLDNESWPVMSPTPLSLTSPARRAPLPKHLPQQDVFHSVNSVTAESIAVVEPQPVYTPLLPPPPRPVSPHKPQRRPLLPSVWIGPTSMPPTTVRHIDQLSMENSTRDPSPLHSPFITSDKSLEMDEGPKPIPVIPLSGRPVWPRSPSRRPRSGRNDDSHRSPPSPRSHVSGSGPSSPMSTSYARAPRMRRALSSPASAVANPQMAASFMPPFNHGMPFLANVTPILPPGGPGFVYQPYYIPPVPPVPPVFLPTQPSEPPTPTSSFEDYVFVKNRRAGRAVRERQQRKEERRVVELGLAAVHNGFTAVSVPTAHVPTDSHGRRRSLSLNNAPVPIPASIPSSTMNSPPYAPAIPPHEADVCAWFWQGGWCPQGQYCDMRHVESPDSAQKRREMVGIVKPCAEYAYFRQCPHPRCKTIALSATTDHPTPHSEPQAGNTSCLEATAMKEAASIQQQDQAQAVAVKMESGGDAEAAREIDDDESIPLCS